MSDAQRREAALAFLFAHPDPAWLDDDLSLVLVDRFGNHVETIVGTWLGPSGKPDGRGLRRGTGRPAPDGPPYEEDDLPSRPCTINGVCPACHDTCKVGEPCHDPVCPMTGLHPVGGPLGQERRPCSDGGDHV